MVLVFVVKEEKEDLDFREGSRSRSVLIPSFISSTKSMYHHRPSPKSHPRRIDTQTSYYVGP